MKRSMLKRILILVLLLSSISCTNFSQNFDKELEKKEVRFEFTVNENTFPSEWKNEEIDAYGVKLDPSEIARSKKVIQKALSKYPKEVLENHLERISILKSIRFFGVDYGGTNMDKVVYLANSGKENGYTDAFIEKTFHHEFSSVLLLNYPQYFEEKKWTVFNGFDYFDASGGVNAIKNGTDGLNFDEKFLEAGFLFEYGASSMENDLNSFAENIFCQSDEFRNLLKKYPRINYKYKLMIDFYSKINPAFTESWFKKQSERK